MEEDELTLLVRDLEDVRRKRFAELLPDDDPDPSADRDAAARWLAIQHLGTDPGIRDVYYLTDPPTNEVRFLEVNHLLHSQFDDDPVKAFSLGCDVEGWSYKFYVVDLTPKQMEGVRNGSVALPSGWSFEPHQKFSRKSV